MNERRGSGWHRSSGCGESTLRRGSDRGEVGDKISGSAKTTKTRNGRSGKTTGRNPRATHQVSEDPIKEGLNSPKKSGKERMNRLKLLKTPQHTSI